LTTNQSGEVRNPQATGTSWTPSAPLIPGAQYQWWIRALSNNGDTSPWVGPMQYQVQLLDTPQLQTPSGNIDMLHPVFTWKPVAGASYYDVWVGDVTGAVFPVLENPQASAAGWKPATALTVDHQYVFYVRALSTNGDVSLWSNGVTFAIHHLATPTAQAPIG